MKRPAELRDPSRRESPIQVQGQETVSLSGGWEAARTPPGGCDGPSGLDELEWIPAEVPGTAAGALAAAGLWQPGEAYDFDAEDWWFRTAFDAAGAGRGERVLLALDGLATIAEVYLNGELLLESSSMFASHLLDVGGRLAGANELAVCCRALGPRLSERRRPRARWRTRLVSDGNLRFFRTMLLGRTPGIAPETATAGPWREVRIERRTDLSIDQLELRTRMDGADGVLTVSVRAGWLSAAAPTRLEVQVSGPSGEHSSELELRTAVEGSLTAAGEVRVTGVAQWWPHTHGEANLHRVRLTFTGGAKPITVEAGNVGFRRISAAAQGAGDVRRDGLDIHVNGVRVFARGAVWTPIDLVGMAPSEQAVRERLNTIRAAGMNMVRIPGTGAYETAAFHEICDELGILVWQDFMFANLDYPVADEEFRAAVESEAGAVLQRVGGHPSTAVLCGNSEVEQQAAMLGLDPALGRGELFEEVLPGLIGSSGVDAIYVPSAPCGGELPFQPGRGVGTYFGVGAYGRPLEDARRAGVLFAAECLAFSNVPGEDGVLEVLPRGPARLAEDEAAWRSGVPRDSGADWDFDDVRARYLEMLFGVDARELMSSDGERYLQLSRIVTGEVMARVFGEWRRAPSPCGGGIVLSLGDLRPGAGWGLLDHRGAPKAVLHRLGRALAPTAVWTVDEGVNGVIAHVANDGPAPLSASLRVSLYRESEHRIEEARAPVDLAPHSQGEWNVEGILGHFVDASWAYRFGPAQQDLIVCSLEDGPDGGPLISQDMYFPAGFPLAQAGAQELGLSGDVRALDDGSAVARIATGRLLYGAQLHVPGYGAGDDAFSIEPSGELDVTLAPLSPQSTLSSASLTAVNLLGRLTLDLGAS